MLQRLLGKAAMIVALHGHAHQLVIDLIIFNHMNLQGCLRIWPHLL
jgi:hypothetical protein